MPFRFVVVVCVVSATWTGIARADRQSTAAAIFEQGIKDLQAGKLDLACRELANSIATWPDSGAKGALAECETLRGKLATAWQLWVDLSTTAPTAELRADATANARQLAPRVPHVVVRPRTDAPAGLRVTLNGQRVDLRATAPLAVDPGPILVEAEAPGLAPWKQTFQGVEGVTTEIAIPLATPWVDRGPARRRQRLIGLSIGGAGIAALGVGAFLGARTFSSWNDAVDACGGATQQCDRSGLARATAARDDARTSATWSTALVGVGGAAVVTGLIVFLTAPRNERPTAAWRVTPIATPETIGLAVSGVLR